MKVIGFTGAQGTGKSTVLESIRDWATLNNVSHKVVVDTISMSRMAQQRIDDTANLATIVSDVGRAIDLQTEIRQSKNLHLQILVDINPTAEVIFTDRTPIDFMAYARLWLVQNKVDLSHNYDVNKWYHDYLKLCTVDLEQYSSIVYFPIGAFPFVAEDARASLETQADHSAYCKEFIYDAELSDKTLSLNETTVIARRDEVLRALGLLR